MLTRNSLILSAVAIAAAGTASAQVGNTEFIVANDSDYVAVSFQTAEGDKWSSDWIPRDAIVPGEQFVMRFTMPPADCIVPTKVTFEDGFNFEGDVDYCETAMLTLHNTAVVAR